MSIAVDNIKGVLELLDESLSKLGFEKKTGLEVQENGAYATFSGEKGALKLKYENEIAAVYFADDEAALEEGGKKLVATLLPENGDSRDVKYVANEIADCLNERFAKKSGGQKERYGQGAPDRFQNRGQKRLVL